MNLARRAAAETLGTAMLLAAVVGSGIMAERLAGGNAALTLLANTIATGAALVALILTWGPISGAHLNPAVTLSFAVRSELAWRDAAVYIVAQSTGAIAGVVTANLMFSLPPVFFSARVRSGSAQFLSEFVATFGLVVVVLLCAKFQARVIAFAVAAYITAAYWFTASTSFANPAVTLARSLSDTFTGIRPADVPMFVLAQLLGAAAAALLTRWLIGVEPRRDPMTDKKRVLILCTGNVARSQMGEGLLRHFGGDRFEVFSGGLVPSYVRPNAIAVMKELGIDISDHRSKSLDEFLETPFDYVITVCDHASEHCPIFPGPAKRIHWSINDPVVPGGNDEAQLEAFRAARDDLKSRIQEFVANESG